MAIAAFIQLDGTIDTTQKTNQTSKGSRSGFRRNGKLLKKKFTNYDDALHDPSVKISDDIIMFDEVGYELGCIDGLT